MKRRNPKRARCPRCREQVDTDLFEDTNHHRARVIMPHRGVGLFCSGTFKSIPLMGDDETTVKAHYAHPVVLSMSELEEFIGDEVREQCGMSLWEMADAGPAPEEGTTEVIVIFLEDGA